MIRRCEERNIYLYVFCFCLRAPCLYTRRIFSLRKIKSQLKKKGTFFNEFKTSVIFSVYASVTIKCL